MWICLSEKIYCSIRCKTLLFDSSIIYYTGQLKKMFTLFWEHLDDIISDCPHIHYPCEHILGILHRWLKEC